MNESFLPYHELQEMLPLSIQQYSCMKPINRPYRLRRTRAAVMTYLKRKHDTIYTILSGCQFLLQKALFAWDIISDILVITTLLSAGHTIWGSLMITFVCLPYAAMACAAVFGFLKAADESGTPFSEAGLGLQLCLMICCIIPVGSIVFAFAVVYFVMSDLFLMICPIIPNTDQYTFRYRATRKLLEVTVESFPATILQTYMAAVGFSDVSTPLLLASLAGSILSFIMQLVSVYETSRDYNMTMRGFVALRLYQLTASGVIRPAYTEALQSGSLEQLDIGVKERKYDAGEVRAIAAVRQGEANKQVAGIARDVGHYSAADAKEGWVVCGNAAAPPEDLPPHVPYQKDIKWTWEAWNTGCHTQADRVQRALVHNAWHTVTAAKFMSAVLANAQFCSRLTLNHCWFARPGIQYLPAGCLGACSFSHWTVLSFASALVHDVRVEALQDEAEPASDQPCTRLVLDDEEERNWAGFACGVYAVLTGLASMPEVARQIVAAFTRSADTSGAAARDTSTSLSAVKPQPVVNPYEAITSAQPLANKQEEVRQLHSDTSLMCVTVPIEEPCTGRLHILLKAVGEVPNVPDAVWAHVADKMVAAAATGVIRAKLPHKFTPSQSDLDADLSPTLRNVVRAAGDIREAAALVNAYHQLDLTLQGVESHVMEHLRRAAHAWNSTLLVEQYPECKLHVTDDATVRAA